MEEEVHGGPARGRGHGGRGTRGRGRGRCANRGRGLDGLEDAAVGAGRSGAADWGGHGDRHGCGHGRGGVSNVGWQRLADAFEDGDDYHQLAALLGIPYQMARSIIHVWLAEGRVQRLPEGGAHNIKLTDGMQAFIRDFVLQQPFTIIAAVGQELAVRFPDTAISDSTIAWHLQNQLITTKTAGKDSDLSYERNRPNTIERRFQYARHMIGQPRWVFTFICLCHQRQVYIDESGFNIFTRRSKGRAPLGERVRRIVAPRGRNVNITLAISPDTGLVHHVIEQRTVTRATFQAFTNELLVILAPRVPINEEVFIIFDGARPHLSIVVPPEFQDRFHVVMLPPYCLFFNPVEQAHSCLKSEIKQHLVLPHIQAEILDILDILETCGRRLVSISSSGEPTCCFELGTTHFSKLHNRNEHTGARVFIDISLHLSIEKSFAIKSDFINVNKYIVIVNEHFII